MVKRSGRFYSLVVVWFYLAGGNIVTYGRNWYISGTGKDEASCDFDDPCKTIWHAVNVASRDDSIYLDGTNTDKNPYACQSGASAYPGIFINKGLSLIGYGNQLAWIQCSGQNSLTFNGTSASRGMRTKLSNIGFKGGAMNFLDFSAHIENATFEDSTGVNFVIHNKMMSSLHIADSTFSKSKGCVSVTSSTNQNITFNLTLENVTLSQNDVGKKGLVSLDVVSGSHNIHFQNVAFKDNHGAGRYDNECIIQRLQAAVKIFIDSSYFRGQDTRLFQISGSDISLFIHNSSFVGHKVSQGYGSGAVLSLTGTNHPQQSISLNVSNSSFVNTSADQCAAVNVQCAGACSTRFLDCNFIGNTAERGSGGAVCISIVSKRYCSACKVSDKTTTNTVLNETSSVAVPVALNVTIQRCTFLKNKAMLYDAGAVSISAGSRASIILQEVTVESNSARNFGGAISIDANENGNREDRGSHNRDVVDSLEECNITITLSNFSNNVAGQDGGAGGAGGAIYLKGNNPVNLFLEKVSMKSNIALYSGGAVHVETISSLVVQESLFSNNNASGSDVAMGGAMTLKQLKSDNRTSILTIENSIFLNNEAKANGGACIIETIEANNKQAVLKLTNLTVVSNTAKSDGGAFAIKHFHAIQIHDSRFLNNTSLTTVGGAISVGEVDTLEVRECLFGNNHAGVTGFGGALHVLSKRTSPSIEINNTTFYNCSAKQVGGAFYLRAFGKATLKVAGSRFEENHAVKYYGGAMAVYVKLLESPLLFEDTTFEKNEASFGGALHLSNGNATFQSCSFIDNIASTEGGHLHTAVGSSNLAILNSIFNQTVFKLQGGRNLTAGTFFVDTEGTGTLYITNTSLTANFPETNGPLLQVRNGRQVSLDNSTTMFCPNGSRMKIFNFQGKIDDEKVATVQISCSSCEGNTYSLSRGDACGFQPGPMVSCALCPFGANCTRNIFAKPNFWGFREETDPSVLKFATCPFGYCRSPLESDFPEYNRCQGNRTGTLCGRCKESYAETLYSPTCRPVRECNDFWVWPVAFVFVSILALYLTFKPPIVSWIKRQILWFTRQRQENQDENFDRGFMKIIFYFYQAANLVFVPDSTQHILKTDFVETIIGLFNFKQNISPGKLPCPFPGLNVVTKRLLQASPVIGTMLMIPVFYMLHWGIKKIQRREAPSVGPYLGGFLQTLLLGYATLASVSFVLLHCVPIGSKTRLLYDGNIECYRPWQFIFLAVDLIFLYRFCLSCCGALVSYIVEPSR